MSFLLDTFISFALEDRYLYCGGVMLSFFSEYSSRACAYILVFMLYTFFKKYFCQMFELMPVIAFTANDFYPSSKKFNHLLDVILFCCSLET